MANRERVVAALVLLLAFSGCNVQAPPELFTAISQGDLEYTKTTLQENPKLVNSKDESGNTPLLLAAIAGNKDLCEVLIANGANLDVQGQNGTALYEATIGNHKDIVELLINNGANLEAKGQHGTALHEAAIGNRTKQQLETTRILLSFLLTRVPMLTPGIRAAIRRYIMHPLLARAANEIKMTGILPGLLLPMAPK
jgi:hypothetical protein